MPDEFVIFPSDGPWRLAALADEEPVVSIIEPDDVGEETCLSRTCQRMTELGYAGGPVILALPSHWCAAASIDADHLPRRDRHAVLAYRLEEKLPIAAEQFAAGFILNAQKALGVCAIQDKARPVVEQLDARGVYIHSIIPAALLASQHLTHQQANPDTEITVWCHGRHCDIITYDSAHRLPTTWSTLPNDPQDIKLFLGMLAIQGQNPNRIVLAGEQTKTIERMLFESPVTDNVATDETDLISTATRGAELVLSDRIQPWVDLNTTELGASKRAQRIIKPLKAAMVAAVFMLLCLNAAMLWRAHSYQQQADHDKSQQRTLFTDLFPSQTPPLSIDKRLESEYKKISGTRGQSQALPPPPMTLPLLHRVMNYLPDRVRFRLTEFRIEDGMIYLDGQAPSHADVGTIANTLGAADTTLNVETRHTEQLSNGLGVSFVITASPESTPSQVTMR